MPVVICNTSPIQYLYQADVLGLLPALAGQVYVPEAVVAERRYARALELEISGTLGLLLRANFSDSV